VSLEAIRAEAEGLRRRLLQFEEQDPRDGDAGRAQVRQPVLPDRALGRVDAQRRADIDGGLKEEAHEAEGHDTVGLRIRIVLLLSVVDDVVLAPR
jgi:hypothetical protein